MPLKSEQADVDAAIKEINNVIQDTVVYTAINASRNVFEATPKKTTFTASNWGPSIGVADDKVRSVKVGRINRERQTEKIARSYRYPESGRVFITNNSRAIVELNAGKSPQAGAGFVQRAVNKTARDAERNLGRVLRQGVRLRSRGIRELAT